MTFENMKVEAVKTIKLEGGCWIEIEKHIHEQTRITPEVVVYVMYYCFNEDMKRKKTKLWEAPSAQALEDYVKKYIHNIAHEE